MTVKHLPAGQSQEIRAGSPKSRSGLGNWSEKPCRWTSLSPQASASHTPDQHVVSLTQLSLLLLALTVKGVLCQTDGQRDGTGC